MAISYKDAGVDLDLYADAMRRIPRLLKQTHRPGVMPLDGGFAGLFRLFDGSRKYEDPVLVSGTDGVGTKLKLAVRTKTYNTVGIDLVAMCVNDCLCVGAEPLFFLDYLALGKDDPELIAALVEGVSGGCMQAGAALIGGETAIMPDIYSPGDFDMAGFCVGVVEKSQLIDGSRIGVGDVLLGIDSSGVHSNGFSLVRKIVFEAAGLDVGDHVDELGATVGETLLTPTKIYAKLLTDLLADPTRRSAVTGIAHITGGGLVENIERIMPEGTWAQIDRSTWEPAPVFQWLQRLGSVEREEMFRVFNMGIGLVLLVQPAQAKAIGAALNAAGQTWRQLGQVVAGDGGAGYLN